MGFTRNTNTKHCVRGGIINANRKLILMSAATAICSCGCVFRLISLPLAAGRGKSRQHTDARGQIRAQIDGHHLSERRHALVGATAALVLRLAQRSQQLGALECVDELDLDGAIRPRGLRVTRNNSNTRVLNTAHNHA